jgi:hypothetical protein
VGLSCAPPKMDGIEASLESDDYSTGCGEVPSGMRLEFGGAIFGNMRLSFQAARSIG